MGPQIFGTSVGIRSSLKTFWIIVFPNLPNQTKPAKPNQTYQTKPNQTKPTKPNLTCLSKNKNYFLKDHAFETSFSLFLFLTFSLFDILTVSLFDFFSF